VPEGEAGVRQGSRGHVHTQGSCQPADESLKEAVKTAIFQHDHVLLNLTSIILSMAKNHDSLASFPARCLAAEMLSVEVKTKGEDGNVKRDFRLKSL
jgi:hypothetical protein